MVSEKASYIRFHFNSAAVLQKQQSTRLSYKSTQLLADIITVSLVEVSW